MIEVFTLVCMFGAPRSFAVLFFVTYAPLMRHAEKTRLCRRQRSLYCIPDPTGPTGNNGVAYQLLYRIVKSESKALTYFSTSAIPARVTMAPTIEFTEGTCPSTIKARMMPPVTSCDAMMLT